ncbi:MAG: 16S rRNA (guanine(966)-N(2))-methyltransferase RsmD [Rhodocyclaceae bacterium]
MNSVRIIGGQWRRRVLRFPEAEGLRPTPDRVRETLFNWLGQDLRGLNCLDLFAGSGALGFEAASRGAAKVVMVECVPRVLAALEANARMLAAGEGLEIVRADAVKFAASTALRFDVLFLDPPYRQGWIERLIPLLPRILAEDAVLYVESESAMDACGDWRTVRHGKAGQVFYHLMRRGGPDDAE